VARHRRPRKPSPPSRGLLTQQKRLYVRSPVESIRGTKLRTSRRRPITANRSRPKCLRCCSVRRAQHCGHHEGDRLAAAFGARLPGRGGAQETRPEAGIREGRQRAHLSHRGEEQSAQEQEPVGSQGGVTGMRGSMLRRQTRRDWRRNRNPESTLAKPPFCPAKRDDLSLAPQGFFAFCPR